MREFPGSYKFNTGLRAWGSKGRNLPGLVQCYNMIPRKNPQGNTVRLEAISPIIAATTDALDWPFPQLFCGRKANYLCARNYIYTLDSSFNKTATVAVTAGGVWSIADFADYVVFANGSAIYVTNPTTGVVSLYSGSALPVMKQIENFKGQLIGTGVSGYDSNEVVWGDIGYANMDLSTASVESGKSPMPWQGTTHTVKRLGDNFVAYGDGGAMMLSLTEVWRAATVPAFKHQEIFQYGVKAIGGDIHTHLIMDESGKLWRLTSAPKLEELGYAEWFSSMLDASYIQISFDPQERDFYISDGTDCYLLSENGLGKIYQIVSSVQYYRSSLFGTFSAPGATTMIVETDNLDMQLRARKSLEWIGIEGIGDMTTYGKASNSLNETFKQSVSFPVTGGGNTRLKISGVDLRIVLQASNFSGKALEGLSYGWKLEDKNFIRGAYASKTAA